MSIFKSGGGGFLNNVDGTIAGLTFESKEWEGKNGPYSTITAKLDILIDGADAPVPQFLRAGFFYPDTMTIDGATVQGDQLKADTEFAALVLSMVEKGFPEAELNGNDFSPLVGTRVTFVKEIDAEATAKFGKRKGKDGKEYSRDVLKVAAVLGRGAAPKAAKSVPKATGKATAAPAVDQGNAAGVLVDILSAQPNNTVALATLNTAIVKYALAQKMAKAEREAIQAVITDKTFLAQSDAPWTFDGKTVSLAA